MGLPDLQVVGGALIVDGRCLVARRSESMSEPLLWEFPGGKVEAGETMEKALARELGEELDIQVTVKQWLGRGEASNDHQRIVLDVFACELSAGVPTAKEHAELRLVSSEEIAALAFAEADIPVLGAVVNLLRRQGATDPSFR